MSERLKSMRRIAALQAQQKRLAEWKLATLVQRKAALAEAQRDLAGFVDGGELVGRLASEALLQAQRLARREVQAEEQRQAQVGTVRETERRLKLTERTVEQLARDERAEEERRLLERLIEELAGRSPTGDG
jgi:hypothetical protein